jgi:hypothetical protein
MIPGLVAMEFDLGFYRYNMHAKTLALALATAMIRPQCRQALFRCWWWVHWVAPGARVDVGVC